MQVVGWILVLIAVKYISDIVADKTIYYNAIIAVILSIIGAVAGLFVLSGSAWNRKMGAIQLSIAPQG